MYKYKKINAVLTARFKFNSHDFFFFFLYYIPLHFQVPTKMLNGNNIELRSKLL